MTIPAYDIYNYVSSEPVISVVILINYYISHNCGVERADSERLDVFRKRGPR